MRFDEMTDVIRKRWWQGLQVDYRIVDRLVGSSPRSKLKIYVREYPGSPATPIPTITPDKGPRDA
jgi:hypothetical protein